MDGIQTPHIKVSNLRVDFEQHEILHGIGLSLNRGEFVALVGRSGSGKSTLLHALAGFIQYEGNIQMPSDMGMVFQSYAVFPWLTVSGNIAFGLHGPDHFNKREIVDHHLELVGLTSEAHKYPNQLSGGQTQRVALARALAPNPEVVLMDEPFGALDMYTREKMQTWLLDIWEKNQKTVLFVTHNIEEAIFLSDRVVVLGNGKVLSEFRISFDRPRMESIKFLTEFIEQKKQILELIEHTNGP
jgi:NitT/TauT family transport system ATP-binding protein